jgi:hypothetical protein
MGVFHDKKTAQSTKGESARPCCCIAHQVLDNVVMLSVIMLSVIMLSVIMLSFVMLSVIMPNVVAPLFLLQTLLLLIPSLMLTHSGDKFLLLSMSYSWGQEFTNFLTMILRYFFQYVCLTPKNDFKNEDYSYGEAPLSI